MTPPLVKRYLAALDRHKWIGMAGFVVVMGLATAAALQPKPPASYVASGFLAYSSPPVTVSQTGTALQQQQQQGQTLTPEILLSDFVVNAVGQPSGIAPQTIRQQAVLVVNPKPQGDDRPQQTAALRILVTYSSPKAAQAEEIATRLMTAMVEQSRLFNTQQLANMANNLKQLSAQVGGELQQSEDALKQYVRSQGSVILAAQESDIVGAITGSQVQQRQIRLNLEGINAQISSLQSRLGLTPDQAYTASALSADPIIASLRAQIYQTETQLQVLRQDLRPNHPTMVQLHNQQQAYQQLLRQRVDEVIGGNQTAAPLPNDRQIRQGSSLDPARQQLALTLVNLQTQRDTLQQQLTALTRSEQTLRQQYTVIPDRQLQQSRLQQDVTLKRSFYDQIQSRLEDVTLAEKETVGSLVIAQPAKTELAAAASPASWVILIVGGVVGLIVGGGLVLLLDSLDATFHTLPELQTALRQQEAPILGLLPLMPLALDRAGLPLVEDADSPYLEPYERFRSNLRRSAGSQAIKMVVITSTIDGEGKTVSAYNLAIAAARAGKRTLLIEADLRSASHARSLNVTLEARQEPLRYYGQQNDCIRLVPAIENLYLLPNLSVQGAAAVLESSEMRQLLKDVRGRFDFVVLDTPALSRYNDALLLEPYCDGLVLVTRPGYTEGELLNEAIDQFTESEDIQFLGAVINGANISIQIPDEQGDRLAAKPLSSLGHS